MQTSLTYRTNRDLFSNHYLTEHLPKTEAWDELSDEELTEVREDIMELWEREKETASQRNESQLEEKFIRPMFRKLGIPFEVEESTSRTQRRPDYGFFASEDAARNAFQRREQDGDFYQNAVAVADAKRWGRPLDTRGSGEHERDFENPSYQIHVYLQETPTRWAVLTDGKKWRLYYGPTSHRLDSYYEIDLPTVLEKGDLEDFKNFYLFFRHEAFLEDSSGECFLDEVYSESNIFAQELGEDLQDNIYEAIKVLSEGFMQYPDNDLSEVDLDRIHDSSLIYLYRLIFVLYAESEGRDLLDTNNKIYQESYSLNTLKQNVAEELDSASPKYQDWQDNLWNRLDELFKLIDQGSKSRGIPEEDLYIPAYNGGLFRTDPDEDDGAEAQFIANHQVGDAYLAEVIELLTRSENGNGGGKIFVDYSSLDVRHLGSIYEGLLEYELNIADEPLALDDGEYVSADESDQVMIDEGEVYLTTDSGERKATGSYYTPEYVVEHIVENTLEPLVNDIREGLMAQSAHGDGGFAEDFAERVFDLKILDPAMGSGHFLTSTVDYLAREIIDAQEKQAAQQGIESVDEEHDINWARRKVAQRCIYGVDINPLAVELAKVSLWLRTLAAEQPLAFLDHHLKTGNSLVGSDIEDVLGQDTPTTDNGQLTLQESFAHTRQQALKHVMNSFQDLLSIDNETLEDIKEMEDVYDEVRDDPLYQHLLSMVNVHTANKLGLKTPTDAHEQMAEALRDDSWEKIETQDWFRTAQKMADDEKFFHWTLEFPVAFYDQNGVKKENPGFDAVIGNPPYVVYVEEQEGRDSDFRIYEEVSPQKLEYLRGTYPNSTEYAPNLFAVMTELSLEITRTGGQFGFIYPSSILYYYHFQELRNFISNQKTIRTILRIKDVFEGVETGGNAILTIENTPPSDNSTQIDQIEETGDKIGFETVNQSVFSTIPWVRWPTEVNLISVMKKVHEGTTELESAGSFYQGVCTGNNSKWIQDTGDHRLAEKVLRGRDIQEFHVNWAGKYLIFDKDEMWSNTDEKLLRANPKILLRQTGDSLIAALDDQGHLIIDSLYLFKPNSGYDNSVLTALFNSTLLNRLYQFYCPEMDRAFAQVKVVNLRPLPIPDIDFEITENERKEWAQKCESDIDFGSTTEISHIQTIENVEKSIVDDVEYQLISNLTEKIQLWKKKRNKLNTDLLDYLGNYSEGPSLPDIGLFQPTASNELDATSEEYNNLRVGDVKVEYNQRDIVIYATARYKPENKEAYETDRWGYTETGYKEAFTLTDLSEEEAALVEAFVSVVIDKSDGFAGFRDNATKTNSLIDRLKAITLPALEEVSDDLQRYLESKSRADELDEKIKKTDQLIDEIVYDLYNLSDEEIKIVESSIKS